ncbi:MAG: phosphatidylglycerol--membrane-oligosaccharide glycerophosphotransferase [Congregibacter sp.]
MLFLILTTVGFLGALSLLIAKPGPLWSAVVAGLLTLCFTLLGITWLIADQFTGEGFNAAVLYHLRVGLGGGGTLEYLGLLLTTIALIAVAVFVSFRIFRLLARHSGGARRSAFALIVLMALLCVVHPTSNAYLEIHNFALYGENSVFLRAARHDGGAGPERQTFRNYYEIPPLEQRPTKSSNLLILYAESLERTYFNEDLFPGLMTELRALEDEAISFTNIRQMRGTGFTIAGIVASQCGIPLTTSGHPNSMRGMAEFLPGAVCLGDLLSARGYTLQYMGGANLDFAGKGKFFESHGFSSVEGLTELKANLEDPNYLSTWGLFDDSLLDLLYRRFERLSEDGAPFALVGLTMDTHHPHGHASQSCENLRYGDGGNSLLNAVKCSDHLIAQLVRKVRNSPWGARTDIVIASDHLAMRNDATETLQQGERRNLLMLFPAEEYAARRIDKPASSFDTAALLLNLIDPASTRLGLGRALLADGQSLVQTLPGFGQLLRTWRPDLAAFWQLPDSIETLQLAGDGSYLNIDEKRYATPALLTLEGNKLRSIRFEFDSTTSLTDYVRREDPSQTLLWIDSCRKVRSMNLDLPRQGNCFFLGSGGGTKTKSTQLESPVTLTGKELIALATTATDPQHYEARLRNLDALLTFGDANIRRATLTADTLRMNLPTEIRSVGGPGARSYIQTGETRIDLQRGLNLLVLDNGKPQLLARYDACATPKAVEQGAGADLAFQLRSALDPGIDPEIERDRDFLLVVHDSASCGAKDKVMLSSVLSGTSLSAWQQLDVRTPYVAILSAKPEQDAFEMLGDRLSTLIVEATDQGL